MVHSISSYHHGKNQKLLMTNFRRNGQIPRFLTLNSPSSPDQNFPRYVIILKLYLLLPSNIIKKLQSFNELVLKGAGCLTPFLTFSNSNFALEGMQFCLGM